MAERSGGEQNDASNQNKSHTNRGTPYSAPPE
jgi:hypothetical protein